MANCGGTGLVWFGRLLLAAEVVVGAVCAKAYEPAPTMPMEVKASNVLYEFFIKFRELYTLVTNVGLNVNL